jgi:hypothetical protein
MDSGFNLLDSLTYKQDKIKALHEAPIFISPKNYSYLILFPPKKEEADKVWVKGRLPLSNS